MTIDHLLWFAEEARRAYGRVVPNQAEGKRHLASATRGNRASPPTAFSIAGTRQAEL